MEENNLIIQRAKELAVELKDNVSKLKSQMLNQENKEQTEAWVEQCHIILKNEFNLSSIQILSVDWSEPYKPEVKISEKPLIER